MPCTRSMRSKTKAGGGGEEVEAAPKTRSTRARTASKKQTEGTVSAAELPPSKSPTPSATSARSIRSRTRSKAQGPEKKFEVIDVSESPRATRSVKQKPAPSVEKGAKKNAKKPKEADKEGEIEEILPEAPAALKPKGKGDTKASTSKKIQELPSHSKSKPEQTVPKATAKKRKAPRARTRRQNNGPSESDDLSTDQEEQNARRRRRLLTVEELHKYFVTPLKSAMHAVEVVPKFMESIMDSEAVKEQEEEFQRLLHRYDMPPPTAAPKKNAGSGRSRKKRARSPEQTTSKTEIPQSFNFTEAPVAPAKKKMIMNSNFVEEDASGDSAVPAPNSAQEEEEVFVREVENVNLSPEENKNTAEKFNEENQERSEKTSQVHSKEQPNVAQAVASKPKKNEKVGEELSKLPATSTHKVVKTKNVQSSSFEAETQVVTNNDPNATFVLPSASPEEKTNPSSLLNITKTIEKLPEPELPTPATLMPKQKTFETPLVPVMPPPHLSSLQQDSSPTLLQNSAASQTFTKEPSSDSAMEQGEGEVAITSTSKTEKTIKDKDPGKTANKTESSTKTGHASGSGKQQDVYNSQSLEEEERKPNPLMNVTVCIEKSSFPVVPATSKQNFKTPTVPVIPPRLGNIPQESNPRFLHDSPANRTFTKELPLAAVMEEEEGKDDPVSNSSEKTNKAPHKTTKATSKNDPSTKGLSSSSSSSSCSMKSATSQPGFSTKDKKNPNPTPGSAGKQQDTYNSKPLEDAEKRRQELLRQKAEITKKKREDWEKKRENKHLLEEKKLKEKQKQAVQLPPTNNYVPKKPPSVKFPSTVAPISSGLMKPKVQPSHPVPFPIKPFPAASSITSQTMAFKSLYKAPPPPLPPTDVDMDDSFKSANASAANSFLDATMDGPLNSYDITVYEDLDDDLRHRENKPIPTWASERDSLKTALFSMIFLPDFEYKYYKTFPRQDRSFKLFPNK